MDFPVPSGMPVPTARRVLARAAVEMAAEARWRASILDPPEVWGIETISPDGVLIRVTARTAPQARQDVTRELRERLKSALDAELAPVAAGPAIPRQAGRPQRQRGQRQRRRARSSGAGTGPNTLGG